MRFFFTDSSDTLIRGRGLSGKIIIIIIIIFSNCHH